MGKYTVLQYLLLFTAVLDLCVCPMTINRPQAFPKTYTVSESQAFPYIFDNLDEYRLNGEQEPVTWNISSNCASKFDVVPDPGKKDEAGLRLIGALDYEQQTSYDCTVTVWDSDGPPTVLSFPIKITVTNVIDNPPILSSASYDCSIPEEEPALTAIPLTASCNISFKTEVAGDGICLIDGADHTYFTVQTLSSAQTCTIKVAAKYDRENVPNFPVREVLGLGVYVTDKSGGTGSSTVTVTITDINDNAPFCNPLIRYVYPPENQVGILVTTLTCTDPDKGDNANITYGWGLTTNNAGFALDTNTGQITTSAALDFESASPNRDLVLTAADRGNPAKTTTVTIHVVTASANEYAPTWGTWVPAYVASPAPTTEISENATIGTQVFQMVASDQDKGIHGIVKYSLVSVLGGTSVDLSSVFEVDTVGNVKVSKYGTLDAEAYQKVTFQVKATDTNGDPSGLFVTRTVVVTVADSNEFPPNFGLSTSTTVSLNEREPVGTKVHTFTLQDPDVSNTPVKCYITTGDTTKFEISTTNTQEVITKVVIDPDKTLSHATHYDLVIECRDNNGLVPYKSSYHTLVVDITSSNDHDPTIVIDGGVTGITIPENQNLGKIAGITADDKDFGTHGKITCQISAPPAAPFSVIGDCTELHLTGPIDYETTRGYPLVITATDGGLRTATVSFMVNISDINDNAPICAPLYQSVSLPETTTTPVNSPIGTGVASVSCSDADSPGIDLEILNGGTAPFAVNATGQITTTGALDYDSPTQDYTLTVRAKDKADPNTVYFDVYVRVFVTAINEHTPAFTPATANVTAREDLQPGDIIITYRATDLDYPPHYITKYEIMSVDNGGTGKFMIDNTGVIRIAAGQNLDYDTMTQKFYTIVVKATDGGNLFGTGTVIVIVTDANDNTPVFKSKLYQGTIQEDASGGADTGVKVEATDGDVEDTAIRYSKGTGDSSNLFQLDPVSGVITRSAATGLNYDVTKYMQFYVLAKDRTTGVIRTGTSQVVINITDANTHTPICTNIASMNLNESITPGTTLYDFGAVCSDLDLSQTLTYTLKSPTTATPFAVNPVTGVLSLNAAFDYEVNSGPYSVQVEAKDNHAVPKVTTATVAVVLTNVNEFTPYCTVAPPAVGVNENTVTPYTPVLAYTLSGCADGDSGTVLTYTITQYDTTVGSTGPFSLTTGTGSVQVMASSPLNYEAKTTHVLHVEVKDNTPNPSLRSVTYTTTVSVLPVNEFAPVLSGVAFTTSIPENEPVGYALGLTPALTATDADEGSNHKVIRWEFPPGGNPDGYFSIDPTLGTITIAKDLDYEKNQTMNLLVRAVDGGGLASTTTASISIQITDINDNDPLFNNEHYSVNVYAGLIPGTKLLDFTGQLTDADGPGNNDFILSIDGTSTLFAMGGNFLSTMVSLNATPTQHVVNVKVHNTFGTPQRSSTATVTVNVIPANVNPPVYTSFGDTYLIPENAPIGGVLFKANATDIDPGIYGTVRYSMLFDNSSSNFNVDPITAKVYLKNPLDREIHPGPFTLVIKATDGATPAKTATNTYTLCILDVNDNVPQFQPVPANDFSPTVAENSGVDTVVTTVRTSDPDFDANGTVQCFVASQSNGVDWFKIDATDCILKVKNNIIDRETLPVVDVTIEIRDMGNIIVLTNRAVFHVTITDENDSTPDFGSLSNGLNVTIPEGAASGFQVAQVQAVDADEGVNGQITYSLSGTYATRFSIDATGRITTTQILDRELIERYDLTITATDKGTPTAKASSIPLTVFLSDINDNPPVVLGSPYSGSIPENAPVSTFVAKISATDRDSVYGKLTYAITGGDIYEMFRVGADGRVETAKTGFDRETTASYTLNITVSDNGSPALSTVPVVIVTITDVNDNAPEVSPNPDNRTIAENSPLGSLVGAPLNATDKDDGPLNNLIRFAFDASILGPNYFTINATSGQISVAVAALDRETNPVFIYRFKVYDAGTPALTSSVTVRIDLLDVNDNIPEFTATYFNATISEATAVGTSVLTVSATDKDINENANLTYYIDTTTANGATADTHFYLNPNTGLLTVKAALDYETYTYHDFKILVKDGGSPTYTGTGNVYVVITDINDVAPTFDPSFISSEVPIQDDGTMLIADVNATDPDTGTGGQLDFSWDNAVIYFSIETSTGYVRRVSNFEIEPNLIYVQYAKSSDLGMPVLSSTNKGTVRIDSFSAHDYVVKITFSMSQTDFNSQLYAIKENLRKTLLGKYPDNRIGFWKVEQEGSNVVGYFYGVQNPYSDVAANISRPKDFIPKSDLLVFWRQDPSGKPSTALLGSDFVNSPIVKVEPYPDGYVIPWWQTIGGIIGLVFLSLALAALLAGAIYGIYWCWKTNPCGGSSAGAYKPGAGNAAAKGAGNKPTAKVNPAREKKILELNKDKHPNKVEPPKAQDKTRIVNQDLTDKVYEPSEQKMYSYDVGENVTQVLNDF